MAEILDRVDGVCGELVLRRNEGALEVIANGTFLMDTRDGRSERLLVTAALDRLTGPATVLLGGLGVGFSLRAALDHAATGAVVVAEREPAVIDWNRTGPLRDSHACALADPRVRVVAEDLLGWLRRTGERFDVLCLDVDNGPQWTVTDGNAGLYDEDGLELLAGRLRPDGVLAVWGAAADAGFTARLRARFTDVRLLEVPVPRGEPDVIWLALG